VRQRDVRRPEQARHAVDCELSCTASGYWALQKAVFIGESRPISKCVHWCTQLLRNISDL